VRGWLKSLVTIAAGAAFLPAGAGVLFAATVAPCGPPDLTAAIDSGQAAAPLATPDRLTIVLAGDTGFNTTDAKVDARGVNKGQQVLSFADTLAAVKSAVDGDLAFVNLETVVTDRNDLQPHGRGKGTFHFRSHPDALKALIDAGFNLFSLANNHAYDYGPQGIEETLYHLAVANAAQPIAFAGIGSTSEEAIRPGCLDLDGARIGFSAIGIATGDQPQSRAGVNKPGQATYRDRSDFVTVVNKLGSLPADYRILSIHYGLEGRVVPDQRQLADWRKFAGEEKGIDLIVGHHPHVAQGVELNGKSLIFYGLGNFMHPGTVEPGRFGICRDYGLMAKVHLARIDGAWKVQAIEAIPLTNTQTRPERFAAEEGSKRIGALNHLAAGLDDGKSAKGVRFTPRADGSGLYCADGAAALGGDIGTLCQGWQAAAEPDTEIESACADKPFYGKPTLVKRKVPRRVPSSPSASPFGAAGPQIR
jgi:poly-gamma-glutamate synthesis protein (capsule biosynthesis protein)